MREVTRFIQDSRKKSGLEVTDRIRLQIAADEDLSADLQQIADEVLAVEIAQVESIESTHSDDDLGLKIELKKA